MLAALEAGAMRQRGDVPVAGPQDPLQRPSRRPALSPAATSTVTPADSQGPAMGISAATAPGLPPTASRSGDACGATVRDSPRLVTL